MTDPNIFNDQEKVTAIAKEHKSMEEVVNTAKVYISILDQIDDDIEILEGDDEELKQIAQDEVVELESEKLALEEKLKNAKKIIQKKTQLLTSPLFKKFNKIFI